MTDVYYVMRENEIIFSGKAADCRRIMEKNPDTRIEPPVKAQARKEEAKWNF